MGFVAWVWKKNHHGRPWHLRCVQSLKCLIIKLQTAPAVSRGVKNTAGWVKTKIVWHTITDYAVCVIKLYAYFFPDLIDIEQKHRFFWESNDSREEKPSGERVSYVIASIFYSFSNRNAKLHIHHSFDIKRFMSNDMHLYVCNAGLVWDLQKNGDENRMYWRQFVGNHSNPVFLESNFLKILYIQSIFIVIYYTCDEERGAPKTPKTISNRIHYECAVEGIPTNGLFSIAAANCSREAPWCRSPR